MYLLKLSRFSFFTLSLLRALLQNLVAIRHLLFWFLFAYFFLLVVDFRLSELVAVLLLHLFAIVLVGVMAILVTRFVIGAILGILEIRGLFLQ